LEKEGKRVDMNNKTYQLCYKKKKNLDQVVQRKRKPHFPPLQTKDEM
jgi:hypothetical protein